MSKKINILFVSHSAGCHGAEKSFITLLKHIDRSRFQPLVIIPQNGPMVKQLREIDINYQIISMPRWVNWEKKRFLEPLRVILEENKAVKQLIPVAGKNNIDIIYSNTIANRTGAKLAKMLNLPHIWHIREILPNNPDLTPVLSLNKTLNYTEINCKEMIVISKAVSKQFSPKIASKTHIVNNYVDFPISDKAICKKDPFVLLFAGTVIKRKGIDTALRAIGLLLKDNQFGKNIVFNIIGTPSKYIEELKCICKNEDITDNINFISHVDNIQDYMTNSNIMLVPSNDEPWGRVVVEAMLSGLPVIVANAGGIPEIINDGQNGFLAKPKDPAEWAHKITWVYNNYDQALKIAQNAREYAKETYTVDNYVGQIETIIGECVGK